jgi:membrane protein YqaA with SNARE-associated domain
MFHYLYEKVISWSEHPKAKYYLCFLSFSESSFFPVPPDVMLAPMCLADRKKSWHFALLTTFSSLLGGIVGYLIGFFIFDLINPWLQSTSYWDAYLQGRQWFNQWGAWIIFIAGFSPIPYKIFTISAGAASINLPIFIIASLIGRGLRFFLVAGIIVLGGDYLADTIKKYINAIGWVTTFFTVIFLLVFNIN